MWTPTRVLSPEIWHSWIEFVYSTRQRLNLNWQLERRPNGNCVCRLSDVSYPYWPPTTFQEAFDMLMLLQDRHNLHRRYLAHRWWVYVLETVGEAITVQPPNVVQNYLEIATSIKLLCPCIEMDMEREVQIRQRARELECINICELVFSSIEANTF